MTTTDPGGKQRPKCSADSCACIYLDGRWECGNCGASGDGWWNMHDGFTMDGEHDCDD